MSGRVGYAVVKATRYTMKLYKNVDGSVDFRNFDD
jgi:hypothetical protein